MKKKSFKPKMEKAIKIAIDKRDKQIMDWCWRNNTIPMKNFFPELEKYCLQLCMTDGGWINVLQLQEFLKNSKGGKHETKI